MKKIHLTDTDKFIYDKEIRPFLPKRIFDAHAHTLNYKSHLNPKQLMPLTDESVLADDVDIISLQHWWQSLFPDSQVTGLLIPTPSKGCDIKAENQFVAENATDKNNRFSILTKPCTSAVELEDKILTSKPDGLKPYMVFAQIDNPSQASITDIINEEQISLADKYQLTITLHVSKPRGMADSGNLKEIDRLTKKYPKANFILAHCGRCFITPNAQDMLEKLPKVANLWIDTSAVCDIGVFISLFSKYDLAKLLFGSDLVTGTGFRGTYTRLGTTWDCCTSRMIQRLSGQKIKATFAAYENLCAVLHAARFCKLTDSQLENIFYNNAANLFNLDVKA